MKELKDLNGPKADIYMAHRIQAIHQAKILQKKLSFWKFVSGFSVATAALFVVYVTYFKPMKTIEYTYAPVQKSMLIQLSDVPIDSRITYVSLEIDEDMTFVLNDETQNNKKEITLAIDNGESISKRLPFVFKALKAGRKTVRIKFLDSDFNVVKEDQQNLEFVDQKI